MHDVYGEIRCEETFWTSKKIITINGTPLKQIGKMRKGQMTYEYETEEGKKQVTYKLKNKPIIKLNIKGKTLNAYIGLNPADFENSKYVFTDSSSVKAYANYPMRVKITSNRQLKKTIELINLAVSGGEL
jgi:predicted transport protein